jgi:uncharacterized protein YfaS (alpha-2-macroglobulin family)
MAFKKLLTLALLSFSTLSMGAEIVSFYPTGNVKKVQQVTARFSKEMIAMGDPRSKIDPFTIECNVNATKKPSVGRKDTKAEVKVPKYQTRWVDNKNWSLDFDNELPAGIRCTFQINSEAKDVAGQSITGNSYVFSTSGPALLGISPRYGDIIPDQYFVALTDGALDESSIEKGAYFETEGLPDKNPAEIVRGGKEELVTAAAKDNWDWRSMVPKKGGKWVKSALERFVVLKAARRFPEGRKVVLHWTEAIQSATHVSVTEPQVFEFKVVDPFTATMNCERSNFDRPCNPIQNISVNFSRRVPLAVLKDARMKGPNGQVYRPVELFEGDQNENGRGRVGRKGEVGVKIITNFEDKEVSSLTFQAPFPEKTDFVIELPAQVKDELGRELTNQASFPLKLQTDEALPLLKFDGLFGILEKNIGAVLPVSVRNLEATLPTKQLAFEGKTLNFSDISQAKQIIDWYKRAAHKGLSWEKRNSELLSTPQAKSFNLPKPSGGKEFELMGIPLSESGFYVVEMKSPKLGAALTSSKAPMYVSTSVLVTDMAVHFKRGRESSLVWVTRLSDAKPVANADVTIVNFDGKEVARGKTDVDGIYRLGVFDFPCRQEWIEGRKESAGKNEDRGEEDEGDSRDRCDTFAFAQKDGDLSFASSAWKQGIESYRFDVSREWVDSRWGPSLFHTVLNRQLAQPGEAVEMKHFLREHHLKNFTHLRTELLPKRVFVVHEGTNKVYPLKFEYDPSTGTALNRFEIPKEAPLGIYAIYLSNKEVLPKKTGAEDAPFDWSSKYVTNFLVSEYRLPLMKATVKLPADDLIAPSSVEADLSAAYLSGGPAAQQKVKLRASLNASYFRPESPGIEGFNFLSSPFKVGTVEEGDSSESGEAQEEAFMNVQDLTLDKNGGKLAKISGIPAVKKAHELTVEMEYSDPNGEIKTASATQKILPADSFVGLKTENWMSTAGKTEVTGVVVDAKGKIRAGQKVLVEAYRTNHITHRKKLVGGFYSYDSRFENKKVGSVCETKTDARGRFTCEAKGLEPGSVTIQAQTRDSQGRVTYAQVSVEIYESGHDFWWAPSDSDRIDVLPEKKKYEPGEKARLVVQSPFPKSQLLVTVEREGVLDSFVTQISRDKPFIEVPLKDNYAPNVFVSVIALRGRVGEPSPTALLDLAKPAMKMGMVGIKVGWKRHELKVALSTPKKVYKTRDTVPVKVKVVAANGEPLPKGSEVVVIALDEALLQLRDNETWKLLDSMMGDRGLAVDTSSGQNQVIGKRHFGSKAKAPGGDGGMEAGDVRQIFEAMRLWAPRVKLNEAGEAEVKVPLNDSITSFRIVAVASGGWGQFGTGETSVQSTKDLIIYSGFPPLLRDGDQTQAAFTVRNTTDQDMKIDVDVQSKELSLPKISSFALKAHDAQTIKAEIRVPAEIKQFTYQLSVKDQKSAAKDALQAVVKVLEAVPARVLQATLFQLDKKNEISVKQPADAIRGRGGLRVTARETLVRGLAGVKSWMQDYDYDCLEQRISRQVVLEDPPALAKLMDSLPSYFDSYDLLKFFPSSLCGDPMLTRYILNIAQANRVSIPAQSQDRALNGLKNFIDGKRGFCRNWWDEIVRDQYANERKVLALESLSRYGKFELPLLATIQATPNLWQNETVVAWHNLLKAHPEIPKGAELLKQAENILHARVNFQGTLMNLQGTPNWEASWRLFTSRDQEAAGVFEIALQNPTWGEDVGRMARGVLARLRMGHWDTTTANAWGLTNMRLFSEKFEKDKVAGKTEMTGGDVHSLFDWAKDPTGGQQFLKWPAKSESNEVKMAFNHLGGGKPWVQFETLSAIPLKAPMELGYKIEREVTPVMQAVSGKSSVGDVYNVKLTITARNDQAWVVVRDPLPGGASHLGTGLKGGSKILDKASLSSSAGAEWPTEFEEKRQDSFVSYAAYLPKGTYTTSYRIRLNSAGTFRLPPSRVEAMYAPETFGEAPLANWKIEP